MASCSAYGCTNRPSKKIPGVTFHCFPKDDIRRKQWIIAVRRKDWLPSHFSKLCSEHFTEDMMDRTSLSYVRLRPHAVPTIFSYLKKECEVQESPAEQVLPDISPDFKIPNQQQLNTQTSDVGVSDAIGDEIATSSNSGGNLCTTLLPVPCGNDSCKRKIEDLETVIESQKKKIKIAQQKIRRYRKKVNSLSDLLSHLEEKN